MVGPVGLTGGSYTGASTVRPKPSSCRPSGVASGPAPTLRVQDDTDAARDDDEQAARADLRADLLRRAERVAVRSSVALPAARL